MHSIRWSAVCAMFFGWTPHALAQLSPPSTFEMQAVCVIFADKTASALPSEKIIASCKKGDIVTLTVPYGNETMLGGAAFCDFSSTIVIVDDPEQKVKKQSCRYVGFIRSLRRSSP